MMMMMMMTMTMTMMADGDGNYDDDVDDYDDYDGNMFIPRFGPPKQCLDFNIVPTSPQEASKIVQDRPKRFSRPPKIALDGPKITPTWPQHRPIGSKRPREASEKLTRERPRRPKRPPGAPKRTTRGHPEVPKRTQGSKRLPDRPRSPQEAQDCTRWPQDAPTSPKHRPRGPKRPPEALEELGMVGPLELLQWVSSPCPRGRRISFGLSPGKI